MVICVCIRACWLNLQVRVCTYISPVITVVRLPRACNLNKESKLEITSHVVHDASTIRSRTWSCFHASHIRQHARGETRDLTELKKLLRCLCLDLCNFKPADQMERQELSQRASQRTNTGLVRVTPTANSVRELASVARKRGRHC